MNTYKNKYTIWEEFEAENDTVADVINQNNLNAIFSNGEFYVRKFKLETEVIEGNSEE